MELTEFKHIEASIEVVATVEDLGVAIPGSLHLVSEEELIALKPIDANEVLRRIPGIHLRADSGPVAMRMNLGMRGLNPDRSRKVLVPEDGIPIALTPYGEPDMYNSPPIERMSRVKALKGGGQILHGPQAVGGVVNFVTADPPAKFHGEFDLEGGQRGVLVGEGSPGGSYRDQSIGWIANYLHKQGDGWRRFDHDIEDLQTQFTFKPNGHHTLALEAGISDEISNSTQSRPDDPDVRAESEPVSGNSRFTGCRTSVRIRVPCVYGQPQRNSWPVRPFYTARNALGTARLRSYG